MGDASALIAGFVLVCLAVELTPGPNMVWLALVSAQRGRIAGLAAVAGVALGLSLLGVLAVVGVGAIVMSQPALYETIRWGGVAYLVYLAYDSWAESRRPLEASEPGADMRRHFTRGLVNNLLNPKAALFFLAVLPNFVSPDARAMGQTIMLGTIYVAIATAIHAGIVLLAGFLSALLVRPGQRRPLGWLFAALLLAVAIWVGVSSAR